MFPLKDINPTTRTPFVTVLLILANVAVFVYELTLGRQVGGFIAAWGVVPYEYTHLTDLVGRYQGIPIEHMPGPAFLPLTLVTSMFIHGGFMHVFGNMLYLWIFGNNVEDLLGPVRFIFFYLACGLIAGAAHIATNPASAVPTVGASGAVAGVLGAYLVAYPRARVLTVVILVIFIQLVELPAALVLLFWFVLQFFQGVASLGGAAGGGVAWFAHIGGFLAGVVGVRILAGRRFRARRRFR